MLFTTFPLATDNHKRQHQGAQRQTLVYPGVWNTDTPLLPSAGDTWNHQGADDYSRGLHYYKRCSGLLSITDEVKYNKV